MMCKLSIIKWTGVVLVGLIIAVLPAGNASAQKGAMQIGLAGHYVWPSMDVAELGPAPAYGIVFHYWLNDTTSIMGSFEQYQFTTDIDVDGSDEDMIYSTSIIEVGVRYHFMVDLFAKPYVEGGVGYQLWITDPDVDFIDGRNGGSIAYFAGAGFDYVFRKSLTISLGGRYHYMPMSEKIEDEATMISPDVYEVDKTKLENVGYAQAVIEFAWRFK